MNLQNQLKQMRDASKERMPQKVLQVFANAIDHLRINKLKDKGLQIGDTVPDAITKNIKEKSFPLSNYITNDYLIVNFYRGGWCPYCNMELREYEQLKNSFNELGTNIVAVSPEVVSLTEQTASKNAITYPILSDENSELMNIFGVAFKIDDASKKEYDNFGKDFTKIHGNDHYELPVPAIYVLNKNREIVYRHFEEDYTHRLEPSELLNIIKSNKLS